jgi:hypothetical protein
MKQTFSSASVVGNLVLIPALFVLTQGCAQRHGGPGRSPGASAAAYPRRYTCHRTTAEITIDGRMDEAAWADAPWTDYFVDIEGNARPRPRLATRARMLWDERYFYIAAQLDEPHVWGTLEQHDQVVYYDNDFEIFIDPDGDARNYYEVEVNALNTIFDLLLERTYIDGGPAHHDWNLKGMKNAVQVDGTLNDPSDVDRGWSVEFALPWRALAEYTHQPAPPRVGDTWRVNFSRVEWQHRVTDGRYEKLPDAPENNWVWSPQGVINMHLPQRWGYVAFAPPAN